MTEKIKAQKKLSEVTFQHEGAHVALVHKDQGGPANNKAYALVLKANNFSPEYITKMQKVQVTLELPEFLRKFFGLYYEDAEVLARMLGYVKPEEEDDSVDWYEDYIEEKVKSFEILKNAYESEDLSSVISGLDEKEYLALLKDQSLVEKALRKKERIDKQAAKNSAGTPVEEGSTEAVAKAKKSDDTNPAKVDPSGVTKTEKNMELEQLQKSFAEQKEALEKALDVIKGYQVKEKEAAIKSKTEQITSIVKDEKQAAVLVKAGLALDDADFTSFVETVKTIHSQVEKSSMFQETGVTSSTDKVEKKTGDGVAALLKAQYNVK